MGDKKRKILLTLLIVGVLGSVAAFGTYSAFTGTTTNSGNSFAAGTVVINDANSSGTALFNVSDQAPGHTTQRCIEIQYTGTLPAKVHMFQTGAGNGSKFQIQVEVGSGLTNLGTRGDCTGFTVGAGGFPNADLSSFGTDYASGMSGQSGDATWTNPTNVDYRITLQPKDDTTANAHTSAVSTGSFSFTWEAHST